MTRLLAAVRLGLSITCPGFVGVSSLVAAEPVVVDLTGRHTAIVTVRNFDGSPAAGKRYALSYVTPQQRHTTWTNKAGAEVKFEFEPLTLISRFAAGRIPSDGRIHLHELAGEPRRFVLQVGEAGHLPGDIPEGFLPISFPDSSVRTNEFTLDLARIIPIGGKAPDFLVRDIFSGSRVTHSNFAGKFLIVKFWATTCPPCIPQMDEHDQLLGRNKREWSDKVAGLAVSLDDDLPKVRDFIRERGWTNFHHTSTSPKGGGFESEVAKAFGVRALPASYIIHPSGVLLWSGHLDQAEVRMRYLLENVKTAEDITNWVGSIQAVRR